MGGHFAAGLGTVELTVALHYVFDTPHDRLVWDVGHQAYPHKVLTGRRERLRTIKQRDGLAPFPSRAESVYDTFGVGHSSTSISAACGPARAGARGPPGGREAPDRRSDRRWRIERRHGVRGPESRGQLRSRSAGGAERQRHVDLRERRCILELFRARALREALREP